MIDSKFSLKTIQQVSKKVGIVFLAMSGFLYASSAFALSIDTNGTPDVADMLVKLSAAVPDLMRLVTALSYVMGFYFTYKGVVGLKHFGESRSMMSAQHDLKGPLIYLFVGAAMIYLPSTVQTGLSTFWTEPTPYAYVTKETDTWSEFTNACFMIIQLLGTIAFIRGLIILTHLGGQGGQPGQFGKAMAHLVGGILCINIYQFIQVIMNTFSLGQLQP